MKTTRVFRLSNRLPALGAFIFPALILLTGLTALPAQAAPQGRHQAMPDSARAEKRVDRFVSRMEKDLNLSKDQTEKIRAILRKDPIAPPEGGEHGGPGMDPGMRPGMGMMGLHHELAAQLRAGTVDTAALDRSFEEHVTRMRAHHAAMLAKISQVSAVLTPEQRKKAADLLEKRGANMEKREGWRHRGCGKDCPQS